MSKPPLKITYQRLVRDAVKQAVDEGKRKIFSTKYPGLYLLVQKTGSAAWVHVYQHENKRRELRLGGARVGPDGVGIDLLAGYHAMVDAQRELMKGVDPQAVKAAAMSCPKFGEYADAWFEASMAPELNNDKHKDQWRMTLTKYAAPIRDMPLNLILVGHVKKCLLPIWDTKRETATRTRSRIEKVLAAATVEGHRSGPNPAVWKNNLDLVMPRDRERRGNHAAMPAQDLPHFVKHLRTLSSVSARAVEFTILTVARSGETRGMRFDEVVDYSEGPAWVIPAERMKAGSEHRVPLCDRAVEIVEEMRKRFPKSSLVFPGQKEGKALSDMSLMMALRRYELAKVGAGHLIHEPEPEALGRLRSQGLLTTVHGFRSTFRDWCEDNGVPYDLAEHSLAHQIGSKVERSYRRSDALERRRPLMKTWSKFVASESTPDWLD